MNLMNSLISGQIYDVCVYGENEWATMEEERWELEEILHDVEAEEIEALVYQFTDALSMDIVDFDISHFQDVEIKDSINIYTVRRTIYAKDCICDFNDEYIFNHGLDAYSSYGAERNLKEIMNNKEMEICCSFKDQYCGCIGIYVKGKCLAASNTDLYSSFDETGRYFEASTDMIINESEIVYQSNNHHGEAILTDITIVGIWCVEEYMQQALELQKICNVEITTIAQAH